MDIFSSVPNGQHFIAKTRTATLVASDVDVSQKLHIHDQLSGAVTFAASPPIDVEAEMARFQISRFRVQRLGKRGADFVEHLDVRHRIASWRSTDRR